MSAGHTVTKALDRLRFVAFYSIQRVQGYLGAAANLARAEAAANLARAEGEALGLAFRAVEEAYDLGVAHGQQLVDDGMDEVAPGVRKRTRRIGSELARRLEILLRHLSRAKATRAELRDDLAARLGGRRAVDTTLDYGVRNGLVSHEPSARPGARKGSALYGLTEQGSARAAELPSRPGRSS